MPDSNDAVDGSLEKSTASGHWDQFAENERLFGLKTDYDENIYTTAINKSHPQYRERIAAAERKAREIERSVPTTAHVAEERVMDYAPGNDQSGENEEDKYVIYLDCHLESKANPYYRYSGVRRQDFPPLSAGRENKYMPPAKRAPTGQSTVKGAPIDPAIISSQIRAPVKKSSPAPEGPKQKPNEATKNGTSSKAEAPTPSTDAKPVEGAANTQQPPPVAANGKTPEVKITEKGTTTPARNSANAASTSQSPQVTETTPSATSTVERDVLKEFKTFASQQRLTAEKVRNSKAKADKEVKLTELKKFANSFKLSTPVPNDLVSIIAKDPAKQKEIQAKAIKNAEEMAKVNKVEPGVKDKPLAKDSTAKPGEQGTTGSAGPANEVRSSRPPMGQQATPPARGHSQHVGSRQQFGHNSYHSQPYRNNRGGPPQHGPAQQQTGTLAQRLRNVEQQKFSQPPAPHLQQHLATQDIRAPPTGPAGSVDAGYNRRLGAVPGYMSAKLNPNSHEFRPSPFAASFNPNGISASSSPRSAVNNLTDTPANSVPTGQLIRRKTKAIDVKKCYILSHIKSFVPPQGRKWDENAGLRPAYDTLPTWRQLQDDEKADSTMHLTYKQHFERLPFGGPSMATPITQHAMPSQVPHQHQLPFHLQHGAHNMGPRQSPHMTPMQMHNPQHGPVPHPPYNNDDNRMMHSNSSQSYASPRLGPAPVAYNSPGQMHYNQPVFMGPGTPQMGFRSYSNNPQYMSPGQGHMGGPMMMQPQFMPGPQGMMPNPQMMYPGGHPQFMPPSGPQSGPGVNGYPSPGRPAAPMMAQQGSQQGQPMYGMSPNVQYNQPAFAPGQPNGPSM